MPKRKKKPSLQEYDRCAVDGCTLPGVVHLGLISYCLKHIRDRITGQARVSTHLDVVAGPQCKTSQETIRSC